MSKIDSITITFGDQAENHVGMQKIGELAEHGFSLEELELAKERFELIGCICELIDLRSRIADEDIRFEVEPAYILIIHKAVDNILKDLNKNAIDLYNEQKVLDVDKKAKMYGRVVSKSARYNLCFSDENQEPDYENGMGRIISWDSVPLTAYIRTKIPEFIGINGGNLEAEGNYYYNSETCGIGYHGDSERKKVVAVRLGKTIPLSYLWFYKNQYVSNKLEVGSEAASKTIFNLENGSMYIMSEKATGYDWKKRNIYTLRHGAGAGKYISLPVDYKINY